MINSLNGVPGNIAFAGGHFAIKLLQQRGVAWPYRLTTAELDLSRHIVEEIEVLEGHPIAELPQAKLDEYTILISDALLELSRKEFKVDKSRGMKALEELRAKIA